MLDFIKDFQSVVIGSLDEKGNPFSSYAPFVYTNHRTYIFISNVAKHAINLQKTPKASLMFIEDEAQAEQIFARKRISLQCSSKMINTEDEKFISVMNIFKTKFSEDMVSMLMGMSDFNLYELSTDYGEATYGFGEAYNIGGKFMEELVQRTGGTGHGHKKS
ncbi:pyridoxamine 5'-phosphate oxidase family protein [Sulfurimonas sp. MAG313]|nr:pyridoxamine 5'-phosphate oxidase family protein [Sulfurimonas sp. MAG313]MDF1882031.1 pyridoxamine 5'-phosphate oxidase family protein [Sulfurimonas sp. MAG313]